jgi:hypothetical protein
MRITPTFFPNPAEALQVQDAYPSAYSSLTTSPHEYGSL